MSASGRRSPAEHFGGASVDYAGSPAGYITLVIEGPGFHWGVMFPPTSKLPDKIPNLIATRRFFEHRWVRTTFRPPSLDPGRDTRRLTESLHIDVR